MIKRWLYNARSFAAPQNLMPSILTVVMALGVTGWSTVGFDLALGILAILGVCLVHLGGNLLDDYFDYKDELLEYRLGLREEGEQAFTDKYPYLKDGSTTPRQLAIAIAVFLGLAVLCGACIFVGRSLSYTDGVWSWQTDWSLVVISAIAFFLCYFYSAPPFKLGFHGLGELVIGLCFGPCLVCGVYESASGALFTADGGFAWHILALGIGIGLFVTNILYTHSFVERHVDAVSHKKTLAVLLRSNWAGLTAYAIFLFTPFILIIVCVIMGYIHWAYVFVCLMLPQAVWVMWAMVMFAKKIDVPTEHPHKWLGPMDNWDKVEPENRYYLMRWFAMRNINTGFCAIMAIVKIILLCVSFI